MILPVLSMRDQRVVDLVVGVAVDEGARAQRVEVDDVVFEGERDRAAGAGRLGGGGRSGLSSGRRRRGGGGCWRGRLRGFGWLRRLGGLALGRLGRRCRRRRRCRLASAGREQQHGSGSKGGRQEIAAPDHRHSSTWTRCGHDRLSGWIRCRPAPPAGTRPVTGSVASIETWTRVATPSGDTDTIERTARRSAWFSTELYLEARRQDARRAGLRPASSRSRSCSTVLTAGAGPIGDTLRVVTPAAR